MPVVARAQQALEIQVRPMETGDGAFVFGTWLNHLKSGSAYGLGLPRDAFFKSHHRTVEAILKRLTCRVLVGHPPGEPDIIAGYLVTDQIRDTPVIHFAFTKGPFRGHGIQRQLWEASGLDGNECVWTHPNEAEPWVRAKFPQLEVLDFFR